MPPVTTPKSAARPDASRPGKVIPAELAWVETPPQDVLITVQGN